MRLVAFVALAVLVSSVSAGAGTLTSPPVRGQVSPAGVDNQSVVCLFTNIGPKAVAIQGVSILNLDSSKALKLGFSDCEGDLGPNATCSFGSPAGQTGGFGSVAFKGSAKKVRGSCSVVDFDTDAVINSAEMR
jgi:hypothetical protein